MPRKGGVPENLISLDKRSKNEQRKIQSKGGKKSGEVKRERKLISQIYADILAKRLSVPFQEGTEEMTGIELVEHAVKTALATGGGPAVSMMKEIREATEGSKVAMVIEDRTPFEYVDPPKKKNEDR